jgi:hypothetical protein
MKKWKIDSNSARKNQVCSPIKPLAAEKNYNFAGLCYFSKIFQALHKLLKAKFLSDLYLS